MLGLAILQAQVMLENNSKNIKTVLHQSWHLKQDIKLLNLSTCESSMFSSAWTITVHMIYRLPYLKPKVRESLCCCQPASSCSNDKHFALLKRCTHKCVHKFLEFTKRPMHNSMPMQTAKKLPFPFFSPNFKVLYQHASQLTRNISYTFKINVSAKYICDLSVIKMSSLPPLKIIFENHTLLQ